MGNHGDAILRITFSIYHPYFMGNHREIIGKMMGKNGIIMGY